MWWWAHFKIQLACLTRRQICSLIWWHRPQRPKLQQQWHKLNLFCQNNQHMNFFSLIDTPTSHNISFHLRNLERERDSNAWTSLFQRPNPSYSYWLQCKGGWMVIFPRLLQLLFQHLHLLQSIFMHGKAYFLQIYLSMCMVRYSHVVYYAKLLCKNVNHT